MEIITIEEKENPFFQRKELLLTVKHPLSSTPSKADLIKQLAAENAVDESQIVVDYIFTKKGVSESIVKVKILKTPVTKTEQKKGEKVETQTSQNQ